MTNNNEHYQQHPADKFVDAVLGGCGALVSLGIITALIVVIGSLISELNSGDLGTLIFWFFSFILGFLLPIFGVIFGFRLLKSKRRYFGVGILTALIVSLVFVIIPFGGCVLLISGLSMQ